MSVSVINRSEQNVFAGLFDNSDAKYSLPAYGTTEDVKPGAKAELSWPLLQPEVQCGIRSEGFSSPTYTTLNVIKGVKDGDTIVVFGTKDAGQFSFMQTGPFDKLGMFNLSNAKKAVEKERGKFGVNDSTASQLSLSSAIPPLILNSLTDFLKQSVQSAGVNSIIVSGISDIFAMALGEKSKEPSYPDSTQMKNIVEEMVKKSLKDHECVQAEVIIRIAEKNLIQFLNEIRAAKATNSSSSVREWQSDLNDLIHELTISLSGKTPYYYIEFLLDNPDNSKFLLPTVASGYTLYATAKRMHLFSAFMETDESVDDIAYGALLSRMSWQTLWTYISDLHDHASKVLWIVYKFHEWMHAALGLNGIIYSDEKGSNISATYLVNSKHQHVYGKEILDLVNLMSGCYVGSLQALSDLTESMSNNYDTIYQSRSSLVKSIEKASGLSFERNNLEGNTLTGKVSPELNNWMSSNLVDVSYLNVMI